MFAVVEINGFQFKVKENDIIQVNKITSSEKGKKVEVDKVLFIQDETKSIFGKPYIDGAKIVCEYQDDIKGKKIEIMKFRRRSNFKKIKGHRQDYAVLKIEKIIRP